MGYLVFRGTADTNDVFTDLSHSQIFWFSEDGASWGVWAAVHAEVRSNIAAIRRAVRKAQLHRLIIVGHSLGGCYAQEVARLLQEHGAPARLRVVTYGSPAVFARRGGAYDKERALWKRHPSLMDRLWGFVLRTGRAEEDGAMRRLAARSLHVVHRWDLMPRVHLMPSLLLHSQAKAMLNAFTKYFASKLGGAYAARLGGYLSDALALPHNFNRTFQMRSGCLERYQGVGNYLLLPPGLVCDLDQIEAVSQPLPGGVSPHGLSSPQSWQAWDVSLEEGLGRSGGSGGSDGAWVAMITDHGKYLSAVSALGRVTQVLQLLCCKHAAATTLPHSKHTAATAHPNSGVAATQSPCAALTATLGFVGGGEAPSAAAHRAFETWLGAVLQVCGWGGAVGERVSAIVCVCVCV